MTPITFRGFVAAHTKKCEYVVKRINLEMHIEYLSDSIKGAHSSDHHFRGRQEISGRSTMIIVGIPAITPPAAPRVHKNRRRREMTGCVEADPLTPITGCYLVHELAVRFRR